MLLFMSLRHYGVFLTMGLIKKVRHEPFYGNMFGVHSSPRDMTEQPIAGLSLTIRHSIHSLSQVKEVLKYLMISNTPSLESKNSSLQAGRTEETDLQELCSRFV